MIAIAHGSTADATGRDRSLTVANILRRYVDRYQADGYRITPLQQEVLHKILICRTPVLGGHHWRCPKCEGEAILYNSCKHRHCPTCGGAYKSRWIERIETTLLPVNYFHLVFTLPSELRSLALANPWSVFGLLFRASSRAAIELGRERLGAQLGLVGVLHTWGQDMEALHPHIHYFCPGGGLAVDGSGWINAPGRDQLIDVDALRTRFRDLFIEGLEQLYGENLADQERPWERSSPIPESRRLWFQGRLAHLADPQTFAQWLAPLRTRTWMVDCQGPPTEQANGIAAIKYVAGYVRGTAITDARIVADDGENVTFKVKDYRNGGVETQCTISGIEFVRRFLQHILPKGFQRLRYAGMFSSRTKAQNLTRCRELLEEVVQDPELECGDQKPDEPRMVGPTCAACQREMEWVVEIPAMEDWRRGRSTTAHLARRCAPGTPPRPPPVMTEGRSS